jgi:hypothetical protein
MKQMLMPPARQHLMVANWADLLKSGLSASSAPTLFLKWRDDDKQSRIVDKRF